MGRGDAMSWNLAFFKVKGSTITGPHNAVLVGGDGGVDGEALQDAEAWGAPGLVVRPLPPESLPVDVMARDEDHPERVELAAEGIGLRTTRGIMPLAWRDLRFTRLLPNGPKPGDTILAGYGLNFVRLGADGTVSIATTDDGTPQGKSIYAQIRRDGFEWVAPWGKITFDQGGLHVLHYTGARIDLGGIGGLPAPLDSLGSYISISGAIAKIEAAAIALGTSDGAAEPAAKATALLTVLGSISSALSAVDAAVTALSAKAFLGFNAAPEAAAAKLAISNAVGAVTTAAGTLPSTSTTVT